MSAKSRKRFQSGREVFETYVPGYKGTAGGTCVCVSPDEPEMDGKKYAQHLLAKLDKQLAAIKNK